MMSVRVMSLVWDSTVPAPERFTLLALADRADEEGRCWPSVGTLAAKCGTAERTIQRHLISLRELGVLTIHQRFNDSSSYVISLTRLRELAQSESVDVGAAKVAADAGSRRVTTPRQSVTPRQIVTPVNLSPGDNDDVTPRQSVTQYINDPSTPTADAVGEGARKRATASKGEPAVSVRASKTQAATRIPDDFAVTREMAEWCMREFPSVNGRTQTAAFIDHWKAAAGPNARKRDWTAAWRNWIRKADEMATQRGGGRSRGRSTTDDRISDLQRLKRTPAQSTLQAIGGGA